MWRKVAPVPAGLGGGMELGEPPGRDDGDCRAKARSRGQCFYRLHRVRCAGAQPFRCPAPPDRRNPLRRACERHAPRGRRRPGRNHHHCARGRAGPRVSRYRLGHARCVRRCGRPSALVETRHPARDGHPCHRRTRADACPDGLGARDVRRPYEADFADLASGAFKGRSSATQRAMFNFSGHALADLAVAQVVYETALRKGLGTRLAR